jgi:hypothetical protein
MSDDQLGDIIGDAQDHPMSEPAHPVLEATFELLGAVMLHRRQEVARQKAFVAGRRRSLKEIATSAAASLIDLRELKHRAFVEWSKIRFPEGLSLKEIDRRMDALFSFCEPLLTWERYGHRGSSIVGRSGLQLQEAGDRICDFVQAWAQATDQIEAKVRNDPPRGAGQGEVCDSDQGGRGLQRTQKRSVRGRPSVGDMKKEKRFYDDWKASGNHLKEFARARSMKAAEAKAIAARERMRRHRTKLKEIAESQRTK